MLTKNEITALNLSPTKKDFVQIWNELLEVAGKLSERWDPLSTNESDPGIVLLKALTGIADKLNYNIDKNTLEAFMPTAAQEESMRKLCDMLGYNIKYYQSATTKVTLRYHNAEPSDTEKKAIARGVEIPRFMVFSNVDKTVNYFNVTQDARFLNSDSTSVTLDCMEGQVIKCESVNENGLITANQITSDNRFYLPETQIAENGIFIYNIITSNTNNTLFSMEGPRWTAVDNLNTITRGTLAYKFGFDSFESRPYIEFPEDYSELFGSGIVIYYTRTSGANGNISPRTLASLEVPSDDTWKEISVDSFSVENTIAANNGANPETISQAYKNFKKTIGTFDTLVTCRDYMNKICSMVNSDNKAYVSNALVTDIRNDLNRSVVICTADDSGIFYKETPIYDDIEVTKTISGGINEGTKPVFDPNDTSTTSKWHLGSTSGMRLTKSNFIAEDSASFVATATGEVGYDSSRNCWFIKQTPEGGAEKTFYTVLPASTDIEVTEVQSEPAIDHFDLVLYPFKAYNQVRSNVKDIRSVYDSSFTYTANNFDEITTRLKNNELSTIAHAFKKPRPNDIISINNYLKLNALISTNTKLTVEESAFIIDKIKIDLANAFNMRELDFGEEIPFDDILSIIEAADSRIRIVSLAEPALYTTYSVLDSYDENTGVPKVVEYAVASNRWLTEDAAIATKRFRDTSKPYAFDEPLDYYDTVKAREIYNKLIVRNILAGRVPLFNYDETFEIDTSESPYRVTTPASGEPTGIATPTENEPVTLYYEDGDVYTAIKNQPTLKTYEPFSAVQENTERPVQKLETFCNIAAPGGIATNAELKDGEYIKFRAPNFITLATYPAYVNYHLHLANATTQSAIPAQGATLFDLLNEDRLTYDADAGNTNIRWNKVLQYFKSLDLAILGDRGDPNMDADLESDIAKQQAKDARMVKRVTLKQHCSAFKEADENGVVAEANNVKGKSIIVDLVQATTTDGETEKTPQEYLAESGCLRILNTQTSEGFVATIKWADEKRSGDVLTGGYQLVVPIYGSDAADKKINPYIINNGTDVVQQIQSAVQDTLDKLIHVRDNGTPVLPTDGDWYIEFEFECVPFSAASLKYWEYLALNMPAELPIGVEIPAEPIHAGITFDIITGNEKDNAFWRVYGDSYTPGRYVNNQFQKYLPIEEAYIKNLPDDDRLGNIHCLTIAGVDEQPATIANDEEYELRTGERLYFEYTPSTTNADGTTETLPAVTKIYEAGTIIRPSGFAEGLIDSKVLNDSGKSYAKDDVYFKIDQNSGAEIVKLHSLGANEQIEIRDFARTVLENGTLSSLNMYKNFDCEILESHAHNVNGIRSYTLKDGEYIFYTDDDKAELAFFTTGTKVILEGSVVIPKFDKIEIATILDTGIDEVPWQYIPLTNAEDKIIFQEHQYITLGSGDKLGRVILSGYQSDDPDAVPQITSEWTECDKDATYYLSSDPTTEVTLPSVRLATSNGGGWEICSLLALDATPGNTQTLRCADNISTGLLMTSYRNGTPEDPVEVLPAAKQNGTGHYPLSFKTNIACSNGSTQISMDDIYSNPKEYKGFQVKVFAKNSPVIVQTVKGKTFPYFAAGTKPAYWDFAVWPGGIPIAEKSSVDLWSTVDMQDISSWEDNISFDKALKLSANILPNTYGIISIYVSYTSETAAQRASTWIELLPGAEESLLSSEPIIESLNYDNLTLVEPASYNNGDATTGLSTRILLHPGLNCLKINKSNTFFIKSSSNAQGTVAFDDVRLVNVLVKVKETVEEYMQNAFGTTTKIATDYVKTTHGLNLAQIQYLPIADGRVLSDTIQDALRAEVQKGFEAAKDQLKLSANSLIIEDLNEAKTQLSEITNKIKAIKGSNAADTVQNIIEKLEESLDRLIGVDDRTALVSAYSKLESSITVGDRLIKVLDAVDAADNAPNLEGVAKSLTKISEELSSVLDEVEAAELLDQLANAHRALTTATVEENTPEQVYKLLATLNDQDLLGDTLAAIVQLAQKADDDSRYEQLKAILEEIQTPQEHENYRQVLDSLSGLTDLCYRSASADSKLNELEFYSANETIEKVRAAIETIIMRLEATGTITRNAETGEETTEYPTGVETKITAYKGLLTTIATTTAANANELFTEPNWFLTDVMNLATDELTLAIAGYETSFASKELNRVKDLLAKYEELANRVTTEYASPDTEDVINTITSLASGGNIDLPTDGSMSSSVIQLPANNDLAVMLLNTTISTTGISENTLAAIAKLCANLDTKLPNVQTVFRSYFAACLAAVQEQLEDAPDAVTVSTMLDAFADIDGWDDKLEELLGNDKLTTALQNLKTACDTIVTVSTPVSNILTSLITSVGSNSQISSTLSAIELPTNDPLTTVVNQLVQELNSTSGDALKVKLLARKLRSLVQSEKDLRDWVKTRLTQAATEATADIAAINSSSAIIKSLSEEVLKVTPNYASCLVASFEQEEAMSDLLHLLIDLQDITSKAAILDIEAVLSSYENMKDAKHPVLGSWPSLSEAMSKYTKILHVLKAVVSVGNALEANTNFTSLTQLLNNIVAYRDLILTNASSDDTKLREAWQLVKKLLPAIYALENTIKSIDLELHTLPATIEERKKIAMIEEQLMADIRGLDHNHEFYYGVKVEDSLAIDFNEGDEALNTMMNPAVNYHINNVNNSFVISKLDIDHLTKGIQLARSSRLN